MAPSRPGLVHEALYRAFPERVIVADDHCTLVVLQRARHDLRRRRRDARCQDHERAVINDFFVFVLEELDLGEDVLDRDHATLSNEEAGDVPGTLELSAAVAGKVEKQAVGLVLPHLPQEVLDVAAGLSLARIGIAVERREVEDRELSRLPADFDLLELERGCRVFDRDFVPLDRDFETLRGFALPENRQVDGGSAFTTNHRDDVAERHVDDVDRFLPFLRHGDDLVAGNQGLGLVRRAAGDDPLDDGVALLR